MIFSYDPTTSRGLVRLLGLDFEEANAVFADADIDAFLSVNNGNVRLAAAQTLDAQAARTSIVQGATTFAGVSMNGHFVAQMLQSLAAELRRQVYDGEDGADLSPIAIAEWVLDPFSYRERVLNEMMRQS